MSLPVDVRRMHPDDLGRVEAIYKGRAPEVAMSEWLPVARNATDEETNTPLAFVAEIDGRVIGYVVGAVRIWEFGSKPAGWVLSIGVDKKWEGAGAGAELLRHLLRSFSGRGVKTIRTMVLRDDVPVLRFFRSAGFVSGPYTELEIEVPT